MQRIIPAPTSIIMTLNQSGTEWRNPDKIDIDEIQMLRALTDRVDQILISRDRRTKQERLTYAEAKRQIVMKRPHNYNFLTKYLLHGSTIQPRFTPAAEDLLNSFWKDMDKMEIGGGNRNLDSIYRIAEAHARLHLSDVVNLEIAKETLEHYKLLLLDFGKVIVVTEDPRKTAVDSITKVIKRTPVSITFEEAANYARMENEKVRNYLGDGRLTTYGNFKFRAVCDMFKEMKDSHINITSNSPLTCIWQNDVCDENEPMSQQSSRTNYCENSNNVQEDFDGTLEINSHTHTSSCASYSSSSSYSDNNIDNLSKELGINNGIKIVGRGTDCNYSRSYNGILITDVNENQSRSPYRKHRYGCTECDFTSWVYDDAFRHIIMEHLEICIEPEYLKNDDYIQSQTLDQYVDTLRAFPMFIDFSLGSARNTFVKYNSMNQRYFKKLLPKGEPVEIQETDKPNWKNFMEKIGGKDNLDYI